MALALTIAALSLLAQADSKATAELVSSRTSVKPGEVFTVAVRIQTEPGWHVYWRNAGDAGLPTDIRWKLPAGWKVSDVMWPAPHIFGKEGMLSYGYEGEALLLARVTVPKNASKAPAVIAATASWMVCSDVCVQGSASREVRVNVGQSSIDPEWQPKILKAYQALPAEPKGWTFLAEATPTAYVLTAKPPKLWQPATTDFQFAASQSAVVQHATQYAITRAGDAFMLHLPRSEYSAETVKRLRGVLFVPNEGAVKAYGIDVPVQQ